MHDYIHIYSVCVYFMYITGGHNLTFLDLESLTKIENTILADYQGQLDSCKVGSK